MSTIPDLKHYDVDAYDCRIHVAEIGEGPLVLLVHGFPESWYSWRFQLPALAEAGYRVAAIDVRGYGSSEAPDAIDAYRLMDLAGDCVGVVEALGESTATIVGHDWGSPIASSAAQIRPDVFTAVALLSVPFSPRNRHKPTDIFRFIGGDEEFYIEYFQEPGRAEAEIALNPKRWLEGFYFSASGDSPPLKPGEKSMGFVAPGSFLGDRFLFPSEPLSWMTEEDLNFYAEEFHKAGFTGGLNR
ncbi:MAG TPA: alpha/beta hydrolase, partial [Acidimicrobiales bacterium]|nr:alpha/beta hydrolase [Acidimicrobiales bacterium]